MRLHEKNKKHSVPLRDPHQDMLAGIRELAPEIKARAAEIEAARRVPPDLVERLRSIGLFRMFVPRSQGSAGSRAGIPGRRRPVQAAAES